MTITDEDLMKFQTSYKAFDTYPFNDLGLAQSGIHYARLQEALSCHARREEQSELFKNPESAEALSNAFVRSGLIIRPNFFDSEIYENLRLISMLYPEHMNKHDEVILSKQNEPCFELFLNGIVGYLAAACLKVDINHEDFKKQYRENTFVQSVKFDGKNDDEQQMPHMDTFYPSLKFWYFFDDVKADHGAFCYSKGSVNYMGGANGMFPNWYNEQILGVVDGSYDGSRGRGTPEGSLRITLDELEQFGLGYKPVVVEGNTLVIANVMGFHGRGISKKELTRTSIHGSIRLNEPMR